MTEFGELYEWPSGTHLGPATAGHITVARRRDTSLILVNDNLVPWYHDPASAPERFRLAWLRDVPAHLAAPRACHLSIDDDPSDPVPATGDTKSVDGALHPRGTWSFAVRRATFWVGAALVLVALAGLSRDGIVVVHGIEYACPSVRQMFLTGGWIDVYPALVDGAPSRAAYAVCRRELQPSLVTTVVLLLAAVAFLLCSLLAPYRAPRPPDGPEYGWF